MAKLFVNSGDPDQSPRSIILLRVSRLQWVTQKVYFSPISIKYHTEDSRFSQTMITLLLKSKVFFHKTGLDLLNVLYTLIPVI